MKKLFFILCFICLTMTADVLAQGTTAAQPQPPYTDQINCIKTYSIPSEKLYYLTLAGINANKYKPIEVQTKSGYILFKVGNKEFLATIAKSEGINSVIKIAPTNNSYYFLPSIVNNLFYYITLSQSGEAVTLIKGK